MDSKGMIGAGIALVIGIIVVFYVFAYTFPTAATTLSTVAFTSVNAGVVAIAQVVLPLIAVVAVLTFFLKQAL